MLDSFNERVILREELAPRAADARTLRAWLRALPKPCALFCCHDLRALQALYAAREEGLRVPEDGGRRTGCAFLDLGKVAHAAKVYVNGTYAGGEISGTYTIG